MVSFETINKRLGFDFMERNKEYVSLKLQTEDDDMSDSPHLLLTEEELIFVEKEIKKLIKLQETSRR